MLCRHSYIRDLQVKCLKIQVDSLDPRSGRSPPVTQLSSWSSFRSASPSLTSPRPRHTAFCRLNEREAAEKECQCSGNTRTSRYSQGHPCHRFFSFACLWLPRKHLEPGLPASLACWASLFTSTCPTRIRTASHISTRGCSRLPPAELRSYHRLQVTLQRKCFHTQHRKRIILLSKCFYLIAEGFVFFFLLKKNWILK